MNYLPVEMSVSNPPRGAGKQAAATFVGQSMNATFSWGSTPGTATIVYVGNAAGVQTGAMVRLKIGGHLFCGVCKSDVLNDGATEGVTRTLQFEDLRRFLTSDWVFCAFNKADVRLVNGRRVKRWKHLTPANYDSWTWTYTNAPLRAYEILHAIFAAPTVGCAWSCDFTDRNLFPAGVLNAPLYDFEALGGKRLDAALSEVCERTGCVFTLISTASRPYQLVFTRKGYGSLPAVPANTDNRRIGVALSGNATNVRVLGDRNLYQVMDVPLEPDWARAWEQFVVFEVFADELYRRFYASIPGDAEGYQGRQLATARALSITVGEFAELAGVQFADERLYAGRRRMDMPVALYLSQLVFRAFRPASTFQFVNAKGSGAGTFVANREVPLSSLDIADRLLTWVDHDPATGTLVYDLARPADGNGYAIVRGYMVGEDLFKSVSSAQFDLNFFQNASGVWQHVPFQIDDSGEGTRFVIFDQPVIVSPDLVVDVDGQKTINAGFTLEVPPVKAALVFEAERFSYWVGTYPNVSRDTVENVPGLRAELIVDDGNYVEVPYTDGQSCETQAQAIGEAALLRQYTYVEGGHRLVWDPSTPASSFGYALTSMIDRIQITTSPREGTFEVVDYTNERQRDAFEPERELDRRTMQNSLFPGQAELRVQAETALKLAAAFKQLPALTRQLGDLLNGALGRPDALGLTWFENGGAGVGAIPVGTVIRKKPTVAALGAQSAQTIATHPASVTTSDSVFVGATVRHGEDPTRPFKVQRTGTAPVRVKGPVAAGDTVGLASGSSLGEEWGYLVRGGSPSVGRAQQAIADDSVRVIEVTFSAGGGSEVVCRVKDVFDDYLVCRTWNPDTETEGSEDLYVAKEWKDRCSLTGEKVLGVQHTYTYQAGPSETWEVGESDEFNKTRVSNNGTSSEEQRILPPWTENEVILATPAVTGVNTEDEDGMPLDAVTLQIVGRSAQWARRRY